MSGTPKHTALKFDQMFQRSWAKYGLKDKLKEQGFTSAKSAEEQGFTNLEDNKINEMARGKVILSLDQDWLIPEYCSPEGTSGRIVIEGIDGSSKPSTWGPLIEELLLQKDVSLHENKVVVAKKLNEKWTLCSPDPQRVARARQRHEQKQNRRRKARATKQN